MSMTRINTNTDALMATANLNKMSFQLSRTLSHLSTGLRIVTGADDPSGVALMGAFQAQMRGTAVAIQNAEDGLSLMQLADSAMADNMDIMLRMRDLAVRGAQDVTLTSAARIGMNTELSSLMSEITRRAGAVTFNSKILFSGGMSGVTLQVGPDNNAAQLLTIRIPTMSIADINTVSITGAGMSTMTRAASSIDIIQSGINQLSTLQAVVGSQARELERVINSLNSAEVNVAAAASRISDADMASEISAFAKQQVISMAATAMIAQANAQPQQVMKLLGIIG